MNTPIHEDRPQIRTSLNQTSLNQTSLTPSSSALPPQNGLFLHHLLNLLMTGLLPLAVKRGSLILNEIPRDLVVNVDENLLAYVLWNLVNSAINGGRNECIHVEALAADHQTAIRVKDVGARFYQAISGSYRQLQWVAEKLGGSISLDNSRSDVCNVCFSIANPLLAA